mgnify:CR=1 FL=1
MAAIPEEPYPIVYVEWEDPKQEHGWTGKLAENCARIRTVGFLIKTDERGITIVESVAEELEDRWGCSTFIPVQQIIRQAILTGAMPTEQLRPGGPPYDRA